MDPSSETCTTAQEDRDGITDAGDDDVSDTEDVGACHDDTNTSVAIDRRYMNRSSGVKRRSGIWILQRDDTTRDASDESQVANCSTTEALNSDEAHGAVIPIAEAKLNKTLSQNAKPSGGNTNQSAVESDEIYSSPGTQPISAVDELSDSENAFSISAAGGALLSQSDSLSCSSRPAVTNTGVALSERGRQTSASNTDGAGGREVLDSDSGGLERSSVGAPHVFVSTHLLTIHDHISRPDAVTHLVRLELSEGN